MQVEVVYGTADKQKLITLQANPGITARQAVERSGMVRFFPEIDMAHLALGIFSHPCDEEQVLQEGDRVEIYRPLRCDPKEMRRQRAKK